MRTVSAVVVTTPQPWVEQKPVCDHLPLMVDLSWATRRSVLAFEGCVVVGLEAVMPLVRSCLMCMSFVEVRLERFVFIKTRFLRTAFWLVMARAMLSRWLSSCSANAEKRVVGVVEVP